MLAGMIVTDVHHNYMHDTITYYACSWNFNRLQAAIEAPTYKAVLTECEDGDVTVSWKKE